jgi:hypothetical protein
MQLDGKAYSGSVSQAFLPISGSRPKLKDKRVGMLNSV